jgi:deoxycytidylate deaminase
MLSFKNDDKINDLSQTQKKYFELAASVATASPMSKQTGVVIVGNGRVVSDGYNTYGGSFLKDPLGVMIPICSIHAEVMAVMKLWDREKGCKGRKVAQAA